MDACIIAAQKNRYKAWLNNLSINESPKRWTQIKEYVKIINTTEKQTILKGWEKTKLSGGFDLDEQMRDPDFEEEFTLSELMKDLMLEEEAVEAENGLLTDESESNSEDEPELIIPEKTTENKPKKQMLMTCFLSQKNKLLL